MNQKELIKSIKQLKEIKPRKEWALLVKSQILSENKVEASFVAEQKTSGILEILSSVFLQRKFAYSFAALLFLVFGLFGFASYTMPGDLLFPVKKMAEQSQAALTGQIGLRQEVATLNSRISDLAQVTKEGRKDNLSSAINEINANAVALTKNIKDSSDPETLKNIAVSLKTLANVPGTDLMTNPDVKGLYQVVVQSQINDLEKTTLTDSQKETLAKVKDLYDQGKYTDALEEILLINQ